MPVARLVAALICALGYGAVSTPVIRTLAHGRAPRVALTTAAAMAIATISWMQTPALLATSSLLGWLLLTAALVDVLAYRLPDILTLLLGAWGLVEPLAPTPLPDRLLGAAVGFMLLVAVDGIYRRLRGRSGIGLGDAKLLAACGAWLGWQGLAQVLSLGCAGGLVWVAVRVLIQGKAALKRPVPFGAPLCAALWGSWLCQ